MSIIQSLAVYENKEDLSQCIRNLGENHDNILKEICMVMQKIQSLYHNEGNSPWSDLTYDILCEILNEEYGLNLDDGVIGGKQGVSGVGAPMNGYEVKLPYYMGSMNKYKSQKEIELWKKKYSGPYIFSAKLDGISALYMNSKLYTRGNGTMGRDIHYLLPHLNMNVNTNMKPKMAIRGELIMNKTNFDKYKNSYTNARNLVCGLVNRKMKDVENSIYEDIDFVAYDIYGVSWSFDKKFKWLEKHGFNVVSHYINVGNKEGNILNTSQCDAVLKDWKSIDFHYEIDGIIITNHDDHTHEKETNPKYAFAYKNNNLCVGMTQGIVKKVWWNISKDNYLKPKIQLKEHILCDQSKVEYVTGFNAKYIVENNITSGTKLMIGLSGNVIPHIFKVLATDDVNDHDESYYLKDVHEVTTEYAWSKNKIDLICLEKNNPQQWIKQNVVFFKTMGMKCNLQEKTLINVYESLGAVYLKDILSLSLDEWIKVDKMAEKKASGILSCIYDTLDWNIINKKCKDGEIKLYDYFLKLAVGLQTFERGFAMKKVKLFVDYLLSLSSNQNVDFELNQCYILSYIDTNTDLILEQVSVNTPKQITIETMKLFLQGLQKFVMYMSDLRSGNKQFQLVSCQVLFHEIDLNASSKSVETNKKSYIFVFSGVRDKAIEHALIEDGHQIGDSVSKHTTMLIVKDDTKISSKTKKAKTLDVPIYTFAEFIMYYKEFKEKS